MTPATGFRTLARKYKKATRGLQNYGYNIARNVAREHAAQPAAQKAGNTYRTINPFPNPFKSSSYRR